jgi:HSP20 family protein
VANLAKRENAFEELFDFRRDFDGLFNRLLAGPVFNSGAPRRLIVAVPPIEAWVDSKEKQFHMSIAIPGVDPKQIQLNVQGNDLTIAGEQKSAEETKDANFLLREFAYGAFQRTVTMPEGVDTSKLSAEYRNGMLEIVAPLTTAATPKQIEIKSEDKTKSASA